MVIAKRFLLDCARWFQFPLLSFSGPNFPAFGLPYSVRMRQNTYQKNGKYRHFSRSVLFCYERFDHYHLHIKLSEFFIRWCYFFCVMSCICKIKLRWSSKRIGKRDFCTCVNVLDLRDYSVSDFYILCIIRCFSVITFYS